MVMLMMLELVEEVSLLRASVGSEINKTKNADQGESRWMDQRSLMCLFKSATSSRRNDVYVGLEQSALGCCLNSLTLFGHEVRSWGSVREGTGSGEVSFRATLWKASGREIGA
jgi:hypothetical protein